MRRTLTITAVVLISSITLLAIPSTFIPRAHADELELFLNVPKSASPGQTISIELWTVFNEDTSPGGTNSFLAYNATNANCTTVFPCLSFGPKANLNGSIPMTPTAPVVPHVHTPAGGFVALAAFRQWVHPGAWITSYTVPSDLGLYGVHVYANFTVASGRSFVYQAATTFSVVSEPATSSSLAMTQGLVYGILGLSILGVILAALGLSMMRRKSSQTPK